MSVISISATIAVDQLGLVTRAQLVSAGVPGSTIDKALASGRLERAERGVYRVPGVPSTEQARVLALVLASGAGCLASHRTAAWLWGLRAAPPRVELTVPWHRRFRREGVIVHHSRDLDLASETKQAGVPVTGLGRTILDCAGLDAVDAQMLVDEARRRHSISRGLLAHVIDEHAARGRPGLAALRNVVSNDTLPRSDFERMVSTWLRRKGIRDWEANHRLLLPGFGPVELDIAWPSRLVALELEGADHRDRTRVHEYDTRRQNALHLAGWRVLRATYRRWARDRDGLEREIRAVVGQLATLATPQA